MFLCVPPYQNTIARSAQAVGDLEACRNTLQVRPDARILRGVKKDKMDAHNAMDSLSTRSCATLCSPRCLFIAIRYFCKSQRWHYSFDGRKETVWVGDAQTGRWLTKIVAEKGECKEICFKTDLLFNDIALRRNAFLEVIPCEPLTGIVAEYLVGEIFFGFHARRPWSYFPHVPYWNSTKGFSQESSFWEQDDIRFEINEANGDKEWRELVPVVQCLSPDDARQQIEEYARKCGACRDHESWIIKIDGVPPVKL